LAKEFDKPVSRSLAALLGLVLLASCTARPPEATARPDSGKVARVPVPDLQLPKPVPGGAVLEDAWILRSRLPIHGLSAMSLQDDRLMLGTDDGQLFHTTCPSDRSLGGCDDTWRYDARLVARGAPRADLEALAMRPDGSVVLGLENMPRLGLLDRRPDGTMTIRKLEGAPNLRSLPRNAGPEAVTVRPDGRLVTLPEGAVTSEGEATVLVERPEGQWRSMRLRLPRNGLLPTEAAIAGNRLFVLLRGVSLLSGWQMEILALPLAALDGPDDDLPAPETIITLDEKQIADNYEAMAVRQRDKGSYELLVGSDDNGFALQQKLLLLFSWKEPAA
jgi:hypothetical protein